MDENSKQEGFFSVLVILILVFIGIITTGYLYIYQRSRNQIIADSKQLSVPKLPDQQIPKSTSTPVLKQSSVISIFAESDIDVTKIPHDGRLYLALKLSDKSAKNKINVFTKAPESSQLVYSLTGYNGLDINMKVNEVEYSIKVPLDGAGEGPCLMEEFDKQCGYIDEEIQTLSSVKIYLLRIWNREKNIFYLNPVAITKDNFYIDHIGITKVQPDKVFTEEEVSMWRDILKSIDFESVT